MKALIGFIFAIPDLIRLIKSLMKFSEEQENKKKVEDDTKKINDAFSNGDASELNRVFADKKDTDEI